MEQDKKRIVRLNQYVSTRHVLGNTIPPDLVIKFIVLPSKKILLCDVSNNHHDIVESHALSTAHYYGAGYIDVYHDHKIMVLRKFLERKHSLFCTSYFFIDIATLLTDHVSDEYVDYEIQYSLL